MEKIESVGAEMNHYCHAYGCKKEVPPARFMCLKHWRMVPKQLQRQVWATYRPGQEIDKHPSWNYLEITRRAIVEVGDKEGLPIPDAYRKYRSLVPEIEARENAWATN